METGFRTRSCAGKLVNEAGNSLRRAVARTPASVYIDAMVFPPFDPAPPPRRRRFKAIPVRTLLPNLTTLLALCAGLTAIRMAVENRLADFVNVGVAPALILYFWGLHELKSAGWIAALVFAICAALRLARFNVM